MSELTCELNGIKYLVVEIIVVNDKDIDELVDRCQRNEWAIRSTKFVSGGLFTKAYFSVEILIPEDDVKKYSRGEL